MSSNRPPILQIPQCTCPISQCIFQNRNVQSAPVPYHIIHHSEQKCAHFCSERCIVWQMNCGICDMLQTWLRFVKLFHSPWGEVIGMWNGLPVPVYCMTSYLVGALVTWVLLVVFCSHCSFSVFRSISDTQVIHPGLNPQLLISV